MDKDFYKALDEVPKAKKKSAGKAKMDKSFYKALEEVPRDNGGVDLYKAFKKVVKDVKSTPERLRGYIRERERFLSIPFMVVISIVVFVVLVTIISIFTWKWCWHIALAAVVIMWIIRRWYLNGK